MSSCTTNSRASDAARMNVSANCLLVSWSAFSSLTNAGDGGAIYSTVKTTIIASTFTSCSAPSYAGGAIRCVNSDFYILRCCGSLCYANIYCFFDSIGASNSCKGANETSLFQCSPLVSYGSSHATEIYGGYFDIRNVNSSGNRVEYLSNGFSVSYYNSSSTMKMCSFVNNSQNGVLYIWGSTGTPSFAFSYVNFVNNINTYDVIVYSEVSFTLNNGIFSGNSKIDFNVQSECTLTNCYFSTTPISTNSIGFTNCSVGATATFAISFVKLGLCNANIPVTPTVTICFTAQRPSTISQYLAIIDAIEIFFFDL